MYIETIVIRKHIFFLSLSCFSFIPDFWYTQVGGIHQGGGGRLFGQTAPPSSSDENRQFPSTREIKIFRPNFNKKYYYTIKVLIMYLPI